VTAFGDRSTRYDGFLVTEPSDCRYCGSHDIRQLNAAVSGVSGFRCQACGKIFYVASADVSQRIHDAQTKHGRPKTDEPVNRPADRGKH
jgi:hypothetical protein